MQSSQRPKLLAPGGDYLSSLAALDAGADEVYLGLGQFNARRRATNFGLEELNRLAVRARVQGAHIFVTTNVLLTEPEIPEMLDLIAGCHAAGASGVIVQDPGLLYLLSRELPELEVHASTQLTVHNRAQIEYLAGFGVKRVNLSRELSLEEIQELTGAAGELGIGTEVFVHGAYCVSYSGQCFMSSFMGGQSGNRGLCFQPCRRFYRPDGSDEQRLSLSLKDNNALAHVKELSSAGVAALKIEGRMKGPRYVHTLVYAYRAALDGKPYQPESAERVFNRGFSAGYLEGKVTGDMFAAHPFDASLIPAGRVGSYRADETLLTLEPGEHSPAPGDEGVIYTPENRFIALITIEELIGEGRFRISIREALKGRIEPGMRLFIQTGEKEQTELIVRLESQATPSIPLSVEIEAEVGKPLRTSWRAEFSADDAPQATVESTMPLQEARSRGLDRVRLGAQLGKLGGTPFTLESLELSGTDRGFLPLSELNLIRRIAVESLQRRGGPEQEAFERAKAARPIAGNPADDGGSLPRLILLCTASDAEAVKSAAGGETLVAVDPVREGLLRGGELPLADALSFPALLQQDQLTAAAALLDRTAAERPETLVIANNSGAARLAAERGLRWIAGSELHAANAWAIGAANACSASAAVVSRELSAAQLKALQAGAGSLGTLFIPVFGPILLMTTRQCLYRRSFGCEKGVSEASCRDSCSRAGWIEDARGNRFLITKRPGYQTELFNQALLSLPEALRSFPARGYLLDLRLESFGFGRETALAVLAGFLALLRGEVKPAELSADLRRRLLAGATLTKGSYKRGLS